VKTCRIGTVQACMADAYLPDMAGYVVEYWTGRRWVLPVWSQGVTPQLEGPFRTKRECDAAIDATTLVRRDKV